MSANKIAQMSFLPSRGSLGQRLSLAVAAMLLPLIAVASVGMLTFRTTARALESFRSETVGESSRIAELRDLLVKADDSGEDYVEQGDPSLGARFAELGRRIEEGFLGLDTLSTQEERRLASAARDRCSETGPRSGNRDRRSPGL